MENHYQKRTQIIDLDNAKVILTSDYYNGQKLDTHVQISTDFWIAGDMTDQFTKALDELIKKYRI